MLNANTLNNLFTSITLLGDHFQHVKYPGIHEMEWLCAYAMLRLGKRTQYKFQKYFFSLGCLYIMRNYNDVQQSIHFTLL